NNESMRSGVITGVTRDPSSGRIAGHLTFVDPTSLASLATTLPAIAGAAAMQIQLARIERSLDDVKQDLGYLIRHEHLQIEPGLETRLEILRDVYSTVHRRGAVDDDQWDRVVNIEASIRDLHK